LTAGIPGVTAAADCFCTGKVGNVNCDPLDKATIGDVAMLVDHLFISGAALPSIEEANINGDSAGIIDITDVLSLVEHLYITYEELPDCPGPKDYTVYFCDLETGGWNFAHHPSTNEIDSFYIVSSGPMVTSADGRLGYHSNSDDGYVRIVSLDSLQSGDTLQALAVLPLGNVAAVSPDGQLIVSSKGGLSILRTSDYTAIHHDSSLFGQVFSPNSKCVYGRTRETYNAFRLDLSDSLHPVTIKEFTGYLVYDIVPSTDETKWYLYLATYTHQLFAVYDIGADSIIFSEAMWPGDGDLAVTPNGKYVFYTNPGNMYEGPGDYDLRVYDVASNTVIKRVSTYGVIEGLPGEGVLLDYLCATPDSRWLVMLSAHYPYATLALDTRTMVITKYRCLEGPKTLGGLTCQLVR
jgi:hypothetical protein